MITALSRWALSQWQGALKRPKTLAQRLEFISAVEFPAGALARVALAFPEFDEEKLRLCERGFRQYASACALEGAQAGLAMPSKAVDELWHQLMLHSRFYAEFCEEAFGEFLHHEPGPLGARAQRCARPEKAPCAGGAPSRGSEEQELARAWRGASRAEGLGPSEGIPLLFQADALLKTPSGFVYSELDELSALPVSSLRAWAQALPPAPTK